MKLLQLPSRFGPQITTNQTLVRDLKASLSANPTYGGETVGEWIDTLLRFVDRNEPLGSIEFGVTAHGGTGCLRIERDEHGQVEVRERMSHAS